MKNIYILLLSIIASAALTAQTSNIDKGCAPLTVDFMSPAGQESAFWDFDDGGFGNQLSPSHTFDDPGVFAVELFDTQGGTKIGEVIITVFEPIEVTIDASVTEGCAPLLVQFTNTSTVDPGQTITGYTWNFGDASGSNLENPSHTYNDEDTYTVTLRIDVAETGCNAVKTFPDFITTSGKVDASFSLDQTIACTAPADFMITNNTVDEAGFTYLWDFGNGNTSTDKDPGTITYTEDGTYTIKMSVNNGDGCIVDRIRVIRIGKPVINMNIPDTLCIGVATQLQNNSTGNQFQWSFGDGAAPSTSTQRSPTVTYATSGPKIVTFSASATTDCVSDTFFTIIVEDPSAAFTIDPLTSCDEPATYIFTNPNANYEIYEYYIKELDELINGSSNQEYIYTPPPRDSFYINRADTFKVYLDVTTFAGCSALDSAIFIHRAPQAHFIPNISRGCAPLTVNFTEDSKSTEPITEWSWIWGDGDVTTTTTADNMTHTYTDPGEYYVKIAIVNDQGCRDTSAGIFIYVGDPLTADFTVDETAICLYDNVNMAVTSIDPRVDAYHFNTDEGRISDCYTDATATHEYMHSPGVYPVTLTLEYNGCFSEIDNGTTVTVNGSKSRIRYMTNCENPLTVMLQDSSVNASTSIWYIDGDTINMDTIAGDIFNYTFDDSGDYTVKLVTTDDSPCDADSSEVVLSIRQITADFDLPEYVCAYQTLELTAAPSEDVDNSCSKGYTWYGVALRPRTLDVPEMEVAYSPGEFSIRLITEDVNGCTDTIIKQSTALDIDAGFVTDKDTVCLPVEVTFFDQSTADTTIVAWEWSFDSQAQNPTNEFSVGDNTAIKLIIEDAIGCKDSIVRSLNIYEPFSTVTYDPGPIVCVGETITLMASDFTEQGHFLTFNWIVGGQQFMTQNLDYVVSEVGFNNLELNITEDVTGCTNKQQVQLTGIAIPVAEIGSDGSEFCASDLIVNFDNLSTIDGPGAYFWDFGNGSSVSNAPNNQGVGPNVSSNYDGGQYTITLTASSIYGCSDSDELNINVIDPSGQFTISDADGRICINDEITFILTDTMDVDTIIWDFGDGTVVINESPTSHAFGFYPPSGTYDVVLSLLTVEGCKTSINIPVDAFQVAAEIIPDSAACIGIVEFSNAVDDPAAALTYQWDFGNGETSNNRTESIEFTEAGAYNISLSVTSDAAGCQDMTQIVFNVIANPVSGVIDSLICEDDDIYVQINKLDDATVYFIDPDPADLGAITGDRIELDPSISEYIITIIDTITGCETMDTLNISVIASPQVPNLFSPNNDSHNDYFDIVLPEKFRPLVNPSVFKVYNRWGNLVYDNENPAEGWDGRLYNGNVAPAEVYTYVIIVDYTNGTSEKFKGTVTLIY